MSELRDAIEEAYVEEPETQESESEREPQSEPEVHGEAEGEVRGSEEVQQEAPAKPEPGQRQRPEKPAETTEVAEKPAPKAKEPKAPIGWSAGAREAWKGLPPEVKQQVAHREQEIAKAMHNTAEARRTHDAMSQISQTYGSVMAAEGARNPHEAITAMLQTVTELRLGSPAQKAQKMAQLISHYGVDISALDSALAGEKSESSELEQMIDQKMAPVNEMMGQLGNMQLQKQSASQEQANAAVAQFAQNAEFLDDVRMEMADLMDVAQRQGRQLTLQEAYTRACSLNPQVSEIIMKRIEAQKQNVQQKKKAAKSVQGAGQASTARGDVSLHDQISEIWDSYVS